MHLNLGNMVSGIYSMITRSTKIGILFMFTTVLNVSGQKIYSSTGRLTIDTTFGITGAQLKQWNRIEPAITSSILMELKFPQVLTEQHSQPRIFSA